MGSRPDAPQEMKNMGLQPRAVLVILKAVKRVKISLPFLKISNLNPVKTACRSIAL